MKLKIALAQIKPTLGDVEKNLQIHLKSIARAKKEKCGLIVFPELSLTGYFLRDQVTDVARPLKDTLINRFKKESRSISIIVGFVEQAPDSRLYNSCAYFEKGKLKHVHRKVYLPTYGLFDEQRYLTQGDRVRNFDASFGRSSMLVCEDLWHPMIPYTAVIDHANFIFALSSSPGRGIDSEKKHLSARLWEQLNRFYAQFYSVFVIYVNRVGFEDGIHFWGGSEVIDPNGKQLVKAATMQEDFVTAELQLLAQTRARTQNPLLHDERIELTLRELNRLYEQQFKKPF